MYQNGRRKVGRAVKPSDSRKTNKASSYMDNLLLRKILQIFVNIILAVWCNLFEYVNIRKMSYNKTDIDLLSCGYGELATQK